jgi:CubicO group peptidase (beta-lactamase class C family)
MRELLDRIDDRSDTYREDLFRLLRQPSISARDEGTEDCAALLARIMGEYGFEVELKETATHPLVYAEAIVDDDGFDSEHNRTITWKQFLQGTSEWEGTPFGKPDAIDRNRPTGHEEGELGNRGSRALREPGTYWEYNDVRVNRLALALLRVWVKPLPRVLAHEVMDPIGATRTWEWHGYYNSDVVVAGRSTKSVSGGGHWGGGLWASTRDLARFGQLLASRGRWGEKGSSPRSGSTG